MGRAGSEAVAARCPQEEEAQQQILRDTFHMVLRRDEHVCNFLECGRYRNDRAGGAASCPAPEPRIPPSLFGSPDCKLIYRHYATLYFVFCVDSSESELGILDLIQVGAAGTPELLSVGRPLSGPHRLIVGRR